jgi:hypothetical protein
MPLEFVCLPCFPVREGLLEVLILRSVIRPVDQAEADAAEQEPVIRLFDGDVGPGERASVRPPHGEHRVRAPVREGWVGGATGGRRG